MICRCCLNKTTSDFLDGIIDITSTAELYKMVVNKDVREIIITADFAEEYFTPTGLSDFIVNAYAMNEFLSISLDNTYLNQFNRLVDEMNKVRTLNDVIMLGLNNEGFIQALKTVCTQYTSYNTTEYKSNNKINTLLLLLATERENANGLKLAYDRLLENYNEAIAKFDILTSRIKYTYRLNSDTDRILELDSLNNTYKTVLYIKEITRVLYTDTMLNMLRETISSLYNEKMRSIVIEPHYAYNRNALYPNHKSHLSLSVADIMNSNIYMAGFQSQLMQDILKNQNHDRFLMILDRSGWKEPHVRGSNIKVVYTVSNLDDLDLMGLNPDTEDIISYKSKTLYIPHFSDYETLNSEQRIQKYSSTIVLQTLLNKLEV